VSVRNHVYEGERCIYCGVNYHDQMAEVTECLDREPLVHTSETPQEELSEGHLFRFTVSSRGVGRVVGDPTWSEANWWSEPWTLEVRAFNLKDALLKAALAGMGAWDTGEKDDDA
jgi:hypothetical protein